jgi:hypothetical protein
MFRAALALFGRRSVERAERLFVAGIQKPAQKATSHAQFEMKEAANRGGLRFMHHLI